MSYISQKNITGYSVEYVDRQGNKRDVTVYAKNLDHLAHILYDKGIYNPTLIFTASEIQTAAKRAIDTANIIKKLKEVE